MAEDKSGFILYKDLIGVVKKLIEKDRENKTNYSGELFYHILQYVNDENPIAIDFIIEMAFEPIKSQLKRDLKKYETKVSKKSESGKIGNLKRWNKDLYDSVMKGNLTIEEAEKIAESRKTSHRDNSVAKIADTDNDTVNVTDTDILLKKETKQNACVESDILSDPTVLSDLLKLEKEEKEKSSAKKEKENQELRDSEFFQSVCDFFSQTTREQKERVFGEMLRISNQNKFEEFKSQTEAYMSYKSLADEKHHSWNNYPYQWHTENWIDKLKKIEKSNPINDRQKGKFSGNNSNTLKSAI